MTDQMKDCNTCEHVTSFGCQPCVDGKCGEDKRAWQLAAHLVNDTSAERTKDCRVCEGTGKALNTRGHRLFCHACDGTGKLTSVERETKP